MLRLTLICLFFIVYANDVSCKKLRQEISALQSDEDTSGKRTLMIGKFILLPLLAGVGVKFLVLLPIILSKIALLGILSFVSSNLSLLVSAVMGVRSYFFEDKPHEEDYDYDSHHKSRYEFHEPNKHAYPQDDHRYHKGNNDPRDKYPHHYKGYESSYPGYNSYHPDYKDYDYHNPPKKRFRPFKLLGRIKDVIKDHFLKSKDHEEAHHEYDNHYKHHSHDVSDDHDQYYHKEREARLKHSDHSMSNHQSGHEGEYYEGYRVPQDWSHKDEGASNHAMKAAKNQDQEQIKMLVDNGGESMKADLNHTRPMTEYKVYGNEQKFKGPFIVLGLRPQTDDSDSPAAFYATDYQITDFQTEQQADTSK